MKKLFIFLIVIIAAFGGFLFWLFSREQDGVPILVYHQINDIDKNQLTLAIEDFDAQMNFLVENGYTFITPDELLDYWDSQDENIDENSGDAQIDAENKPALPDKPVIITFDDGYVDMYKNVFPILQKYNVKATLFVITDYLNLYPNYLTWAQARELQSSGLVDIESHTLSHFNLINARLSTYEIRNQLYGSKQAIEWYLKKPAKFIAYPEGKYTQEVEDLTKDVGYRAAFTVDYGLSHSSPQHYVLPRIPIFGDNSYPLLRFKLRLLAAPLIAPMQRFKNQLIKDGNGAVADLIWIP